MRKKLMSFLLIISAIVFIIAQFSIVFAGSYCKNLTGVSGQSVKYMDHDGLERSYVLYVPEKYKNNRPMPLVFLIHGLGGTAQSQFDYSELHPLAEKFKFILVSPQGIGNSWNAGGCCGEAAASDIDDVGFISAIIDEVMSEYCVNSNRIYSTGMSNGGFMSYRLACELSDRIAAIGPVVGSLVTSPCNPARPVPVIALNGTDDVLVSYEPSAETIENWAVMNGCSGETEIVYNKGEVECIAYKDCDDGATVKFCTIDGGGHAWPGASLDLYQYGLYLMELNNLPANPYWWAGHTTQDIDASREIWKFFAEHQLTDDDD